MEDLASNRQVTYSTMTKKGYEDPSKAHLSSITRDIGSEGRSYTKLTSSAAKTYTAHWVPTAHLLLYQELDGTFNVSDATSAREGHTADTFKQHVPVLVGGQRGTL
jgi:hypothetical protein